MTDNFVEAEKGPNAWLQALAAVVVVGGGLGGLWALDGGLQQGSADSGPATCSTSRDALPSKYVSGAQLCEALNRPDLATLLGTPEEHTESATGSGDWVTLAGGTKIPSPDATVGFKTYSVKVSASYDTLSVAEMADLLRSSAQSKTILGHPAVLYSDQTISLSFNGSKIDSGPGGIARSLLVARDTKDGGGSYEISIWRQDSVTPDDAALLSVAEQVLPTIPGWTAG